MPPVGFEPKISAVERPQAGHGYLSVVSVVCCQVEVSATSLSLVQRSPADWCVVCDLETSRIGAPYIYIHTHIYIYIYMTLVA